MPDPVADAVAALRGPPGPLAATVAALPGTPGLVAWWADPAGLPVLGGGPPPAGLRPLVVRAATNLRNRVTRQDLYRAGVSPLRRILAGLLLDELALAPTWAADVVLPRADEERLTAWMHAHLLLTWCARDDRAAVLDPVVAALDPALDPGTDLARDALARYTAAAGPRTRHDPSVPFRRP